MLQMKVQGAVHSTEACRRVEDIPYCLPALAGGSAPLLARSGDRSPTSVPPAASGAQECKLSLARLSHSTATTHNHQTSQFLGREKENHFMQLLIPVGCEWVTWN